MPFPRTSTDPPAATLPRASAAEELRVATQLLLPKVAEGLIVRYRATGVAPAERYQWDQRGIDLMRELRERHGGGPLLLRAGGRSVVLLLDRDDVARVLRETPDPFTTASWEKRGALAKFQPHGSLITRGRRRNERRWINEDVLEMDRPLHALAPTVVTTVREEATAVADRAMDAGLTWDGFHRGWWRGVRRVVLGDAAAGDEILTDQLDRLRSAANWSMLRSRRRRLRAEFLLRVQRYAFRAGPRTLAGQLHDVQTEPGTDPVGQIPHWFFAFDAAAIVTLRTLALLATHPQEAARVRAELSTVNLGEPQELPLLRACVLESVRLWPTTPLLLRESTEDTRWRGATVPAGTSFAVFTPYFHRAEPAGSCADRFTPDIWRDGRARANPGFVPFSGGPGRCPGENLVLLTTSSWLAALLENRTYQLDSLPRPSSQIPLPKTLNHFSLHFTAKPG